MYNFGSTLIQLRKEKGYSQEYLAKLVKRNKSDISRYESNVRIPTLDTLTSMAILFGVSLNYLCGIEETKAFTLDGLSQAQINLINTTILEFREHNFMNKFGMSDRQLDILNKLIIEFSDKK